MPQCADTFEPAERGSDEPRKAEPLPQPVLGPISIMTEIEAQVEGRPNRLSIPGVPEQVPFYLRSKLSSPVVVGQPKPEALVSDVTSSPHPPARPPAAPAPPKLLRFSGPFLTETSHSR